LKDSGVSNPAIIDAGPLIALLDASDQHHAWAIAQFAAIRAPLLTCEAVLAEALFILRKLRPAQEQIRDWMADGVLEVAFSLQREAQAVKSLWARYANVPISIADASLVRMAELYRGTPICTLDSDFTIYRLRGREPIPLLSPSAS
jgi:uncharacterized protein